MSKLAGIRAYQNSGYYAGDFKDFLRKVVSKGKGLFSKGKKLVSGLTEKATQAIEDVSSQAFPGENGGGGGGRGGGARRRSRGITARELRGYRKVANLLHREGMVSRRGRGRK